MDPLQFAYRAGSGGGCHFNIQDREVGEGCHFNIQGREVGGGCHFNIQGGEGVEDATLTYRAGRGWRMPL